MVDWTRGGQKLCVLELFAGIGACSSALSRLGIEYELVDAVEIDKYAIASFNAIHGTNFEIQDITKWDKNIECDLIMHGSPCQDFSMAGKQAGGDMGSGTRSSLMYETIRIVEKLKPQYVVWENVKNLLSKKHKHNFDAYIKTMENLGYKNYYKVLNAKDYGIPQNRERVFTVSIRADIDNKYSFPIPQELKLKLKDLLENEVDEKYYLSNKAIQGRQNTNYEKYKLEKNLLNNKEIHPTICARYEGAPSLLKEQLCNNLIDNHMVEEGDVIAHNYSNDRMKNFKTQNNANKDISPTLTTRPDCLGICVDNTNEKIGLYDNTSSDNFAKGKRDYGFRDEYGTLKCTPKYAIYNSKDLRIRKLTPKECWRLMGFTDEEFKKAQAVNSNAQLYKQAGNSIVVNVLVEIFKSLFN